MTVKKLIGMALALILLVTVAILQHHGGKSPSANDSGKQSTLFEGIDLNTVSAIDVENGSNSVALVKPDGKWTIASLFGYPADFGKLANTIRSAAQAKLGSPVRAGNVDESEYGLGADAKKIVLKAGDKILATIVVGATRKGSDSAANTREYFIRRNDDPSIYLVDYDFGSFSNTAEDWMDKQLVSVRSGDLVEVKTDDIDLQQDGTTWKLADLDPATEDFQTPVANRLRSGLRYLTCDSVADPSQTDEKLGFDAPAHYTARTRDGFTYSVTLGAAKDDKGRYVRMAVDYEKPEPPVAPADDAEQAQKDEYKQKLDAYNAATAANAKKAKELTARWSHWTYVIDTYTANSFAIPRSELVKAKTPPSDKESTPTPPASAPPAVAPPGQ